MAFTVNYGDGVPSGLRSQAHLVEEAGLSQVGLIKMPVHGGVRVTVDNLGNCAGRAAVQLARQCQDAA